MTPEEIRLIVDLVRAEARRKVLGPTAVVVSTDVAFGMLRMLRMLRMREQLVEDVALIRPFRDDAAAVEWLAIQGGPGTTGRARGSPSPQARSPGRWRSRVSRRDG